MTAETMVFEIEEAHDPSEVRVRSRLYLKRLSGHEKKERSKQRPHFLYLSPWKKKRRTREGHYESKSLAFTIPVTSQNPNFVGNPKQTNANHAFSSI